MNRLKHIRNLSLLARLPAFGSFLLLCFFAFSVTSLITQAAMGNAAKPPKFKPIMLYVTGAQDSDRDFIEMARKGLEKSRKELKIEIGEQKVPENKDPTEFIKKMAEDGYSPIIAVGYQNVVPVLNLAQKYPDTHFTVIDGLVPPIYPNVQSIIFKDHEGAFLVGMIAAYTSTNSHIGFIGGMDVPLIRNFGLGYTQGAKFVRPNITVDVDYVGTTPAAWGQPDVAYELAGKQFDKGCDVIFAAAGGSSIGVLRSANDKNKLAIGVDTNQNGVFPGHVLTSMIKRVDVAVFDTVKSSKENRWSAGIKALGLKESALDFSVDDNNKHLVTEQIVQQVLNTRERIINGIIDVEMYSPN